MSSMVMHFGLLKNAIILKKRDFESFFFIIWKLLLKFSKFSNFGISNACWNHRISWQILVQGYEDLTKKHHHRRELEHTFFGRGNAQEFLWKFMKIHEISWIFKKKNENYLMIKFYEVIQNHKQNIKCPRDKKSYTSRSQTFWKHTFSMNKTSDVSNASS